MSGPEGERHVRREDAVPGWLHATSTWTFRVIAVIGGVSLFALLGTVVGDVLLRYLAGSGIAGANDMVASWWMASIVFPGIALAQYTGGRIQVDFLVDALAPRLRQVVDVIVLGLSFVLGLLLAWGGFVEAMHQMQIGEYAAIGDRPIWPARFLVPLGFAAFSFACAVSIVHLVVAGPAEQLPERQREVTP